MPSSSPQLIPYVIRSLCQVRWESMLDVGCGRGKYGALMREYGRGYDGGQRIDAVEFHEPNLTSLHSAVYDRVVVGDILDVLPSLGHYDVVSMVAVLVHMPKGIGEQVVRGILVQCQPEVLVLTVPTREWPQDEVDGNLRERHYAARWEPRDFRRLARYVAFRDLPHRERVVAMSDSQPVVVTNPYASEAARACHRAVEVAKAGTKAGLRSFLGQQRCERLIASAKRIVPWRG